MAGKPLPMQLWEDIKQARLDNIPQKDVLVMSKYKVAKQELIRDYDASIVLRKGTT